MKANTDDRTRLDHDYVRKLVAPKKGAVTHWDA